MIISRETRIENSMILLSFIIFQKVDSGSDFCPQTAKSFDLPYFFVTTSTGEGRMEWNVMSLVTFSKFGLYCTEHFKQKDFQKPVRNLEKIKKMDQKQQ